MGYLDPSFVGVLLAVSALVFVVTSATGVGAAIFLIPLLMFRMPAAHAISLVAPITLVGNLSRALLMREHLHKRATWICALASVPLSAVSALYTVELDTQLLKLMVGGLVLLSMLLDSLRPGALQLHDLGLGIAGVIAGVLSGLAGLAGPPGVLALRAYGLERERFVATLSLWGVLLQAAKIPSYVATGAMPWELWPLAIVMSALSMFGAWVATRWLKDMRTESFRRLLDGSLGLIAMLLILEGLRG